MQMPRPEILKEQYDEAKDLRSRVLEVHTLFTDLVYTNERIVGENVTQTRGTGDYISRLEDTPEVMRTRLRAAIYVKAFNQMYQFYHKLGHRPKLQRLDNEISTDLELFLAQHSVGQLSRYGITFPLIA
jgi:hypothetical protein